MMSKLDAGFSSSGGGVFICCRNHMLAVVIFSQDRVSSSKTVRPATPRVARCMGHVEITWSAVVQFDEGARPHLCIDE